MIMGVIFFLKRKTKKKRKNITSHTRVILQKRWKRCPKYYHDLSHIDDNDINNNVYNDDNDTFDLIKLMI